jgi:integrase
MSVKKKPAYQLHKGTGQAKVRIEGKDHYLGPYGSPESRERYEELISEWFAKQGDLSGFSLTVDDLVLLYMQHAAVHYQKDGKPTSEVHCIRLAFKPLIASFGHSRAREFGPLKLKRVRESMIDSGAVRISINTHIGRIKRMFRWGVEHELFPVDVYQALCSVRGLQAGRTNAVESEPVKPVDEGTVNDTLTHLPTVLQAMVQLQLLTGMRPGEACQLKPCDITFGTDGVWCFRPERHKTQHVGKERRIYIGPEGQYLLRPFLDREPDEFCFSPRESEVRRNIERRKNRFSPMTPSQTKRTPLENRKRPPKGHYTKDSYCRAVARACEKANVEKWTPNQLRHSRATIIREKYGIEAAQTVLGHSDPKTTEIYAERDFQMAARIMREIG